MLVEMIPSRVPRKCGDGLLHVAGLPRSARFGQSPRHNARAPRDGSPGLPAQSPPPPPRLHRFVIVCASCGARQRALASLVALQGIRLGRPASVLCPLPSGDYIDGPPRSLLDWKLPQSQANGLTASESLLRHPVGAPAGRPIYRYSLRSSTQMFFCSLRSQARATATEALMSAIRRHGGAALPTCSRRGAAPSCLTRTPDPYRVALLACPISKPPDRLLEVGAF